MKNTEQTPEFDREVFIDGLSTMTAFIANKKGLKDLDKLELVHDFLEQVERKITEEEHQPTTEDMAVATLNVLEEASDLTPKQFDDKAVNFLKWLHKMFKEGTTFYGWFKAIKARRQAIRAARKERKEAKKLEKKN